jgi:hypothetical protein
VTLREQKEQKDMKDKFMKANLILIQDIIKKGFSSRPMFPLLESVKIFMHKSFIEEPHQLKAMSVIKEFSDMIMVKLSESEKRYVARVVQELEGKVNGKTVPKSTSNKKAAKTNTSSEGDKENKTSNKPQKKASAAKKVEIGKKQKARDIKEEDEEKVVVEKKVNQA